MKTAAFDEFEFLPRSVYWPAEIRNGKPKMPYSPNAHGLSEMPPRARER